MDLSKSCWESAPKVRLVHFPNYLFGVIMAVTMNAGRHKLLTYQYNKTKGSATFIQCPQLYSNWFDCWNYTLTMYIRPYDEKTML